MNNIIFLSLSNCRLSGSSSFKVFWESLTNLKTLKVLSNRFNLDTLVDLLDSVLKSNSIQEFRLKENKADNYFLDSPLILEKLQNTLKKNIHLRFVRFQFSLADFSKQYLSQLQEIIDSHPSIVYLAVNNIVLSSKKPESNLKKLFRRQLQNNYDKPRSLHEVQLIAMGDGRTGKTSTLRTICKKRFRKDNPSTIVLEDINVFQVDESEQDLKSITKYQLSVQRVKNVIGGSLNMDEKVSLLKKYSLPFEEELLQRTIQDDLFVREFTISDRKFTSRDSFCRIYDFGGQEIFSSVHHIFMNPRAIYLVIFNMTKFNQYDISRLRFWCESIVKYAPNAPILFIELFLRKNKREELSTINNKLELVLKKLSLELDVIKTPEAEYFFPVENAAGPESNQAFLIKKTILQVMQHKRRAKGIENSINLKVPTVWVLFIDNCREETGYMTLDKFRLRAASCKFSEADADKMLQVYTQAGLITFIDQLELPDEENYIFFAPSFIAQALGSFIRDPSFHELAFRLNKKVFPDYRKYIDTGIIRRNLFEVLLQEYTIPQRKYVLKVALESLILIEFELEKDSYFVPELLPPFSGTKIVPALTPHFVLEFKEAVSKSTFVHIINCILKQTEVLEPLIYMGFSRFNISTTLTVDLWVKTNNEVALSMVQGSDFDWLRNIINTILVEINKDIKVTSLI
eukprot:snap_masked-scaffold_65-processed-gene-0.30-mRNA-1 protein AED:1.00 eAED:1.00 QI:0/0/0/0/1/1/7/0/685